MSNVKHGIVTVRGLLEMSLNIPEYQRPYKWKPKHVRQLMEDVLLQSKEKNETYRLGTLVLHRNTPKKEEGGVETLNIVDGQQRTLTLALLFMAIAENKKRFETTLKDAGFDFEDSKLASFKEKTFTGNKTHAHVYQNYQEIARCLEAWDAETVRFLLDRCELVCVELQDLSEAFQFFDSQNARGKDMYPHDLLKAYHLRAMLDRSAAAQEDAVRQWENMDAEALGALFEDYLFRIRNWRKGRHARYFTKEDIGIFKGVNVDDRAPYPYRRAAVLVHHTVMEYNRHYLRGIDRGKLNYPYQLDQVILNGRHFFDWVAHYQALLQSTTSLEQLPKGKVRALFSYLKNYNRRHLTGDQYVRMMYVCSLLYYGDRFGDEQLDAVGTHLFRWAFQLRLIRERVQMASIDNYAIDSGMFTQLGEALTPGEILDLPVSAKLKADWETIQNGDYIKDLFQP